MKLTTRKLVVTAVLAALILLFQFSSIGYIKIGVVQLTIMGIPVIIGAIMEGLVPGLILSLFFIGTSFIQLFMGDPMLIVFNQSPQNALFICLIIIIPRLLIPVTTWALFRGISGKTPSLKRQGLAAGFAALAGSLTNTVLFLFMLYLLLGNAFAQLVQTSMELVGGVIAMIGVVNGLPEAGLTVLVTVPIVVALKKVYGRAKPKQQPRS